MQLNGYQNAMQKLLKNKLNQIKKYSSQHLVRQQKKQSLQLMKILKILQICHQQKDVPICFQQKVHSLNQVNIDERELLSQQQSQKIQAAKQVKGFPLLLRMWISIINHIKIKISCSFIDSGYFSLYSYLFAKEAILFRDNQSDNSQSLFSFVKQSIEINDINGCYDQKGYPVSISRRCRHVNNSLEDFKNKYKQYELDQTIDLRIRLACEYDPYSVQNKQILQSCVNCPQAPLNLVTQFYENSQIEQYMLCHDSWYKNYFINSQQSSVIFQQSSSNLIEEMLCRSANFGAGIIYLGLDAIQSYRIQQNLYKNPFTKQMPQYIIKHLEQKRQELPAFQLKQLICKGVQMNDQEKVENAVASAISSIELIMDTKNPSTKMEILPQIQYVPVYKDIVPRLKRGKNKIIWIEDKNPKYIVKIKLDFSKNLSPKLVYAQTKKTGSNSYSLYGEEVGLDSTNARKDLKANGIGINQNKLYGRDIYTQMHKHYEKVIKKTKRKNKNKMQINFDGHSPFIKSKKQKSSYSLKKSDKKFHILIAEQDQQLREYYKGSKVQKFGSKLDPMYEQKFKPNLDLVGSKFMGQQLFGSVPKIKFKHNSIVLVSSKSMEENPSLIQQLEEYLKNEKTNFKIFDKVYENIPRQQCSRMIFFITHEKKYEYILKIVQKIDKWKRNIVIFDIRTQLTLLDSKKYTQAISILQPRFKAMFADNFNVALQVKQSTTGKKFQDYIFQFRTKHQAAFAFILFECNLIKCNFVNKSKLNGLPFWIL